MKLLDSRDLQDHFPAIDSSTYVNAVWNKTGGYAKSGRSIEVLLAYAKKLGVAIHEETTVAKVEIKHAKVQALVTKEKGSIPCEHALIAAGAVTPSLVPDVRGQMKATGHNVFWLKPSDPMIFQSQFLPVFTADISNTGWYGFPLDEEHGVVKFGLHSDGREIDPLRDERIVSKEDTDAFWKFINTSFPSLRDATLVYTRLCLYSDTLDGNFWIDRHPEIKGLSVASGGSGHGFKMAPVLGGIIADMVEGKTNEFLDRFRWRDMHWSEEKKEEARFADSGQSG